MAPFSVCSVCRIRRPGKLANAYWAWFDADGVRHAYKMRYCMYCAPDSLGLLKDAPLQVEQSEYVAACIACGSDASGDSDPMFLTLYLPKQPPRSYELQLDSACAAKLRIPIHQQGDPLENRQDWQRGWREDDEDPWAVLIPVRA